MKVLQITAAYKPAYIYGGPTMSVAMLSEALHKAGITVEVFTTSANGSSELPVILNKKVIVDGVTVTYFKRVTKDHTHFSPALLKCLWKRVKDFDLVHIHAWWNLVSVLSCIIAIARHVPVLISPRGTLSGYSFTNRNTGFKNIIHQFLGVSLLNKSHIHTTSARESGAVQQLIKPLSITAISNFVKLGDRAAYRKNAFSLPLKLLFLSRVEKKKGLDILLDALKTVTIAYHLTIAGDGGKPYTDHLKAKALENNISDKISWAGFFGDDKFELLQQHDLLVLPSHDENFGNVVIESLSAGTAVLISEHVGLAGYVIQHDAGWVFENNAAALGKAILNVAEHGAQKLARISETAPAQVYKDFTGSDLTARYINLYQTITGK